MDDPTEVDSREARSTRSSGVTFVGFLGGAVLAAMLLGQLTDPGPSPQASGAGPTNNASALLGPEPPKPIGVESIKECPVPLGGLVLDPLRVPGSALERWDCDALNGPYSVVIRAAGGHFGVHSAVVTYPVELTGSGVPSTKPPDGVWNPGTQKLTWPLGSSYGQIVGDLGQTTLENLAARVTAGGGAPHFLGLKGFVASDVINYGSPLVHEMRYGTDNLGQAGLRGSGLIYTGVTLGTSFETLVFEDHAKPAGIVRGKMAMFSSVPSGNGALAWESSPGEVSYIGTEGMATRANAVETLRALANNARVLTPRQWETKDRFSVKAHPR